MGFVHGAPVAGGSDSYGYVSQAHLFATGRVREELKLVHDLVPAVPARVLVPLGYLLGADGRTIVPTYSPGLPLVMAIFELAAGRRAVFWVVPLLAGLAVWSTFLLGRAAAGPLAGVAAALLLAASPAFLIQLTAAPMSDLPAAAWWTLALALLFIERSWSIPVAALAAGLAILTRPNLVPVVLVPLLLVAWRAVQERRRAGARRARSGARPRRRELVVFASGVAAGCAVVALLNTLHYGSPLESGYDVRGLFGLEHAVPNLLRYPALLTSMQTPVIWLAALAPWLAWRRRGEKDPAATVACGGIVLAVFSCYLFYPGFDGHVNLRFLVPGLPALFVLLATSLVLASARVRETWRAIIVAALVVAVAVRGIDYATENLAFDTRGERRYEVIAEAIAQRLPPDAVILAMQHSGSVRYYSGREMVRYDQVPPRRLDRLMKRLRNLDRPAYVLLDEWEVPVFQKLFEGSSPLAGLDWPPAIELEQVKVRVWDLTDRQRGQPPRTGDTEVVPWPYPR